MEIKINDQNQVLNFGVRFVRELDKIASLSVKGVSLGMGLTKTLPGLQAFDAAVLSDIIYAATVTNSPRPSRNDVDDYIDGCDNLDEIFNQVTKEINTANATKAALKNMKA